MRRRRLPQSGFCLPLPGERCGRGCCRLSLGRVQGVQQSLRTPVQRGPLTGRALVPRVTPSLSWSVLRRRRLGLAAIFYPRQEFRNQVARRSTFPQRRRQIRTRPRAKSKRGRGPRAPDGVYLIVDSQPRFKTVGSFDPAFGEFGSRAGRRCRCGRWGDRRCGHHDCRRWRKSRSGRVGRGRLPVRRRQACSRSRGRRNRRRHR